MVLHLLGLIKDGVIIKAENLGIENFEIIKRLKAKLEYKEIYIRNDAKCAGLCEKTYGNLKGYDDCIFLCLGTGIGGAVFMGGNLLVPNNGEGFEIGHVVIKQDGIKCNCGNRGCFERYASMKLLRQNIKLRTNLEDITGTEMYDLIKNDTDQFKDIINEFLENLKIGLTNYINIFEPEAICIGGSFAHYGDLLLDKLKEKMIKDNKTYSKRIPKILTAKYENDAGMIGATLVLQK
ncbi:MAG: ROK family protein [Clostridia bacterium]|nr:ROK family protein [Clostridia bacterium]